MVDYREIIRLKNPKFSNLQLRTVCAVLNVSYHGECHSLACPLRIEYL